MLASSPSRRGHELHCTPSEGTISFAFVAATSLTDGRSARAARTRDAVVEALLSLLDDGNFRPTARQVADRAGVSLRSVYVHFDDLEDLFTAAAHRHFERMRDLIDRIPDHGPLETRLDLFTRQRARIHEASAQVRRAAVLQEPFSPALAEVLALARKLSRAEIELVFGAELQGRQGRDRERLVIELDMVSSASVWETLRTHYDRSAEEARELVADTLRACLRER
jgi:TetR/AcrR family transcriptional regulator of autoinduction and epiphytic fitness